MPYIILYIIYPFTGCVFPSTQYPFNTGCLPLSYHGSPGVSNWRILQGWVRTGNARKNRPSLPCSCSQCTLPPSLGYAGLFRLHPFKTVCLPLSYSGNPGVHGVYLTGRANWKHPGKRARGWAGTPPPQYRPFTPESRWHPRGQTGAYLTGRISVCK